MSRLSKRALYQMATTNSTSDTQVSNPSPGEATTVVQFLEVRAANNAPDGRLAGKLTAPALKKVDVNDGASVSSRALRQGQGGLEGFRRNEVLQKLGSGSLGLLTTAYMEQQIMYDDELHTVQQRFYGLQAV